MSKGMTWRCFVSAMIVISVGSLFHFVWEWSGRNIIVAIFAATNESTWEHLKLAFWPACALAPIQRVLYGAYPGWLPATAIRCILPSLLIVALFYGYTALLGQHYLAADIAIFAIAIVVGEFFGHAVLTRKFDSRSQFSALGLLILMAILFSTLTFQPPDFFLFHQPVSAQSGKYPKIK